MKPSLTTYNISPEDLEALKKAKNSMEDIGFLMKGLNAVGGTIETGLKYLPENKQKWLTAKVEYLLMKILKSNLLTMEQGKPFKKPSSKIYKAIVTSTGATSGFFGSANFIGTPIFILELSFSTKFMMRTIMDIARGEGEDLYSVETQLACLQVFSLGGKSKDDDGMETSYYTSRIGMSSILKGVGKGISSYGLEGMSKALITTGNPLTKVIGIIASRFSAQISEKFALQAVPIAGALDGGGINYLFMDHFQKMAKAHFTIRRLEREYGAENIKKLYESI